MLGKGPCAWACCVCTAITARLLLAAVISYMVLPAAMAAHTFGQATGPRNMTFPALPPLTFNPKAPVDTTPGPGRDGGTRSSNSTRHPTPKATTEHFNWKEIEDMEVVQVEGGGFEVRTTTRPKRVLRKASAKASTGDQGKASTGA